jgi:1-acyl-sn-glycerol-3-phosphate acyltransferase
MSGSIVDGFVPEQAEASHAFDEAAAERFYAAVRWISKGVHAEIIGLENIPEGRALLVANHTFSWDVAFPAAEIWHRLHRPVWFLGEHAWWRFPFLRRLAAAVGTVDGTPANVDRLLDRDQLVFVLPGGLREAVKPRELRYRLLWGDRYGFVKASIRNSAPIVPVAALGADDLFDFVGNAYNRGERWLGRPGFPIPLPSRLLPIPHRVHLRFCIGEPIYPRIAPGEAVNPSALRSLRREVAGALHELLECELARRAGIELD